MTPTLGGTIDSKFFARYDATVQAALNSGSNPYVILDLVRHTCIYSQLTIDTLRL